MTKKNNLIVKERRILPRTNAAIKLPDNITWLKQPNILTLMKCDLNKMHLRALIILIQEIQVDMNQRIKGVPYTQLSLFGDTLKNNKIFEIAIPIKSFGVRPNHYTELRHAIQELSKIPIELDVIHPKTGAATFNTTLLSAIIPIEGAQRKNILFRIEPEVAKCLVHIDTKRGLGFTKFIKEIALSSKSKYTLRMYLLISSWKDKGGFEILVSVFKEIFQTSYKDWGDIEKRVLRTAEAELHEKADVWFHVSTIYDPKSSMREPFKLRFKVIKALTEEQKDQLEIIKKTIETILTNLKFSSKRISDLLGNLDINNCARFRDKILEVNGWINGHEKEIGNKNEYFYQSLKNFIDEMKEGEENEKLEMEDGN